MSLIIFPHVSFCFLHWISRLFHVLPVALQAATILLRKANRAKTASSAKTSKFLPDRLRRLPWWSWVRKMGTSRARTWRRLCRAPAECGLVIGLNLGYAGLRNKQQIHLALWFNGKDTSLMRKYLYGFAFGSYRPHLLLRLDVFVLVDEQTGHADRRFVLLQQHLQSGRRLATRGDVIARCCNGGWGRHRPAVLRRRAVSPRRRHFVPFRLRRRRRFGCADVMRRHVGVAAAVAVAAL